MGIENSNPKNSIFLPCFGARQSNFDAYDAAHSPTLYLEDGEYTGTHRPKSWPVDVESCQEAVPKGDWSSNLLCYREWLSATANCLKGAVLKHQELTSHQPRTCFSQDGRQDKFSKLATKNPKIWETKFELIAQRSYNHRVELSSDFEVPLSTLLRRSRCLQRCGPWIPGNEDASCHGTWDEDSKSYARATLLVISQCLG